MLVGKLLQLSVFIKGNYPLSTIHYASLACLNEYGVMTPTSLAELLNIYPASVTRILNKLCKLQPPLINLAPNKDDRRKEDIKITDHGKIVIASLEKKFAHIKEEEKLRLINSIDECISLQIEAKSLENSEKDLTIAG